MTGSEPEAGREVAAAAKAPSRLERTLAEAEERKRRAMPPDARTYALALADAVAAVPGSLVEVMTHPAWNRDAARGAAEVALATDPRLPKLLAARGVRVGHYGESTGLDDRPPRDSPAATRH